jgi:hypothetical protein
LIGGKGEKEVVACANRKEMRSWMKVIGKKIRDFAIQGLQGVGRGMKKEGEEKQVIFRYFFTKKIYLIRKRQKVLPLFSKLILMKFN